jgi:hypothetical protein
VDYRFENYLKRPSKPLSCRTRLSSIFSCLWIFILTDIQQNKYCSVVVKLNEFFYVDYRLESYCKRDSTSIFLTLGYF